MLLPAVAFVIATIVWVLLFQARAAQSGDAFDFARWEVQTLPGAVLYRLAAPLRADPPADEALAAYFALEERHTAEGARLENTVEITIANRIDAVLAEQGIGWEAPPAGPVLPPVNFELADPPHALVLSPRARIESLRVDVLRADLTLAEAQAKERAAEADGTRSALVVETGGVAAYPAVVVIGGDYEQTVATAAHEWTHHYLAPYPLGRAYFGSDGGRVINETVADVVGAEVSKLVLARWGTPGAAGVPSSSPVRPALSADSVLRALRLEVDELLAAGRIDDAERRMEAVRLQLGEAGYSHRRINQAYFAWYGTYAARSDSVDPLGAQVRTIRERAGSLERFLELIRGTTTREDVARLARG